MKAILKSLAVGFSLIAGSQSMDVEKIDVEGDVPLKEIPSYREYITLDVMKNIFTLDVHERILELGNDVSFEAVFGKFRLVCKDWKIDFDNVTSLNRKQFWIDALVSAYGTIGHGDICRQFLNGLLRYTPDGGKVTDLKIMDLKKPFAGEFDLTKCGAAGTYLSICTGYRKGKKPENAIKIEIWFAPWFVISKDIEGPASHFNMIFNRWNCIEAPIGVFWTGGWWNSLDDYCYLKNKDVKSIHSKNLNEIYSLTTVCNPRAFDYFYPRYTRNFMLVLT